MNNALNSTQTLDYHLLSISRRLSHMLEFVNHGNDNLKPTPALDDFFQLVADQNTNPETIRQHVLTNACIFYGELYQLREKMLQTAELSNITEFFNLSDMLGQLIYITSFSEFLKAAHDSFNHDQYLSREIESVTKSFKQGLSMYEKYMNKFLDSNTDTRLMPGVVESIFDSFNYITILSKQLTSCLAIYLGKKSDSKFYSNAKLLVISLVAGSVAMVSGWHNSSPLVQKGEFLLGTACFAGAGYCYWTIRNLKKNEIVLKSNFDNAFGDYVRDRKTMFSKAQKEGRAERLKGLQFPDYLGQSVELKNSATSCKK